MTFHEITIVHGADLRPDIAICGGLKGAGAGAAYEDTRSGERRGTTAHLNSLHGLLAGCPCNDAVRNGTQELESINVIGLRHRQTLVEGTWPCPTREMSNPTPKVPRL